MRGARKTLLQVAGQQRSLQKEGFCSDDARDFLRSTNSSASGRKNGWSTI